MNKYCCGEFKENVAISVCCEPVIIYEDGGWDVQYYVSEENSAGWHETVLENIKYCPFCGTKLPTRGQLKYWDGNLKEGRNERNIGGRISSRNTQGYERTSRTYGGINSTIGEKPSKADNRK